MRKGTTTVRGSGIRASVNSHLVRPDIPVGLVPLLTAQCFNLVAYGTQKGVAFFRNPCPTRVGAWRKLFFQVEDERDASDSG
jgi:hypothetical protein